MLNFARYFFKGIKNTLRLQNGVNFSYKGPWVSVVNDTVIDEWYVGDFMAAEYTIVVDIDNARKQIVKCLVVAGPENASITVFGKTNVSDDLIDITATVNASKVQVIVNPMPGTTITGNKLIFNASYFYTINEITRT